MKHQKPDGTFDYEYDWEAKAYSSEDNAVRQAGALWGVGLLHQAGPRAELRTALERGIRFFDQHSRTGAGPSRCVDYPGAGEGQTGTVALVALARVEYLRSLERSLSPEVVAAHRERLGEYLQHLVRARTPEGLFYGRYSLEDCQPSGTPSPYSDGEALLALVKAAKYLGRRDLEPVILRAAEAGYQHNVEQALAKERDSDTTKGYYQWSSMAFYELFTSGWPNSERYGDWVVRLADWMIDVHRTLWRSRNTGYAYEGLIHAFDVVKRRGDEARRAKYACVIDTGLEKLISWQVGSPIQSRHLGEADHDPLAVGGVQNSAFDPPLRIDVVQHQMHAVLLARRYVYTN
jgi:UDP-N-acetylmuramoyl-tripeptide--D-alanyl-D-alanine ligase